MSSIDKNIEYMQNNVLNYIYINEPYIIEYIYIPLMFEWIFNSSKYKLFRCFLVSLLIFRQYINISNLKYFKFKQNQLLLPFLGYMVLNNQITNITTYSLIYSTNIYEGIIIAGISKFANTYYNFLTGYLLHILYIMCRNNLNIIFERTEPTQGVYIIVKSIKIPNIYNRLINFRNSIDKFINDRLEYLVN